MDKNSTIIVTGAAGFIGSCMVSYLNQQVFLFEPSQKSFHVLIWQYIFYVTADTDPVQDHTRLTRDRSNTGMCISGH